MNGIKKYLLIGTGTLALLTGGFSCSEYSDYGILGSSEQGRTKNSIATVIAGAIGQKMHKDSTIDLTVEKTLFPNARVTGHTTSDSVDTYVDLASTSSHFTALRNAKGQLEGKVDKSEFDWDVVQSSPDVYEIHRMGPKFNAELDITVQNGIISGTYVRNGPHFNWNIHGTYDENGNVTCTVDCPVGLGITLKGTVTPTPKKGK